MNEYIITEKQLKTAMEACLKREIPLPITNVFVSGDKLPEIVRCRDCVNFDPHYADGAYFDETFVGRGTTDTTIRTTCFQMASVIAENGGTHESD